MGLSVGCSTYIAQCFFLLKWNCKAFTVSHLWAHKWIVHSLIYGLRYIVVLWMPCCACTKPCTFETSFKYKYKLPDPWRCGCNIDKCVVWRLMSWTPTPVKSPTIECQIAEVMIWHDMTALVRVTAWCRKVASLYLGQRWPRSPIQYGVTGPDNKYQVRRTPCRKGPGVSNIYMAGVQICVSDTTSVWYFV